MSRIQIENLCFSYRQGEEIIKNLNLTLDERTTAIIGQNGAGKTTLVKLLKGLLPPTAGKILLNGEDTAPLTAAKLAPRIGMVFQNPNDQIFKNTVLEEVMFGPLQIGMNRGNALAYAKEALADVGLAALSEENPYDLGLSQRKMIAIASILAMNTETVIFDEPTIAQDYAGKQRIAEIIRRLRDTGCSVIAILHDMDFVAEVFDRVIVMANGKVLKDGSPREVFADEAVLAEAYLEQPAVTRLGRALGYKEVFLKVEELANGK